MKRGAIKSLAAANKEEKVENFCLLKGTWNSWQLTKRKKRHGIHSSTFFNILCSQTIRFGKMICFMIGNEKVEIFIHCTQLRSFIKNMFLNFVS